MMTLTRIATAGVLALSLTASSLNVAPASAHDNGAGAALAIGAGLIIGGILLNAHRDRFQHHGGPQVFFQGGEQDYNDAGYQQPACYLGPVTYRWVETCRPGQFGDLFCHKTRQPYQEQFCN